MSKNVYEPLNEGFSRGLDHLNATKKPTVNIDAELSKYPRVPKKYLKFTKKHRTKWLWGNVISIIV